MVHDIRITISFDLMIPEFPNFKKLDVFDREEVESITSRFPSYSDFNFISLCSWDITEELQLSRIGANLVVRFNDYLTGEPFFSFIGDGDANLTARALLAHSEEAGMTKQLKLLPQDMADRLSREEFLLTEDKNNFDYIISINRLKPHDGTEQKLSSRRKLINKMKELQNFYVKPIDASFPTFSKQILALSLTWEEQRGVNVEDAKHLYRALVRALALNDTNENVFSLGAFMDDKLIGYSINEVIGNGYAMGHFQQADLSSSVGVYAFLMQEAAVYLDKLGCEYINLEQDLGLQGLRNWKMSYNPTGFLKKYVVVPVEK